MKSLVFFMSMAVSLSAYSEVFKCTDPVTKRTQYQTKPCAGAKVEKKVKVKRRSAEEDAAAAARLREFETRQAEEQVLKAQIAKERWEAQLRAAEVDAAQRNAAAQFEQAEAQHRQAKEIRKLYSTPAIINNTYR